MEGNDVLPRTRKDRMIPVAPINRLMRQAGATRVADNGSIAMAMKLEEFCTQVTKQAYRLALHAGRKTVNAKDVEFAYDLVLGKHL